ncbi:MAG: TatD family hydrolase, partial [Burkholderiales bacterium]|nr:TatD family hydrolase [Burkholderiales bacterium]
APAPHRGKTNSPAYVPFVAKQLAEIKRVSPGEIGRATSHNFEQLFSVPAAT